MVKHTEKLVKGAFLLTIVGLLSKIISAFYRIPLVYFVGNEGISYYQIVYPIYTLLTSASLVGIPNAVSKLVSEEIAVKSYKKAHKTYIDALIITIILGLIVTFVMFFFTESLMSIVGWEEGTEYVIWGFAISPVFTAIIGATRGYFQGFNIMKPTAITQLIENTVKFIAGIGLVIILKDKVSLPMTVGGAAVGASTGVIIASIYILITYFCYSKKFKFNRQRDKSIIDLSKHIKIVKNIILLALPVTIVSAAYSIMNSIDSFTLTKELAEVGLDYKSKEIFGQIGKVISVINVPLTISIALSVSIVPSIAEAVAKKQKDELNSRINQGLKLAILLALPAATGLFMLSQSIMKLLYPADPSGHEYLQLYSICLIFMIFGQALASILQGISKQYIPLISLGCAVIVKIVLNSVLISSILEGKGAAIASIGFYFTFVCINYIALKISTSVSMNIINNFIKPLVSTLIMALSLPIAYKYTYKLVSSNAFSTIITIIFGVIIYFIALILTKSLTKEDLSFMPKKEKIINLLDKLNLIQ